MGIVCWFQLNYCNIPNAMSGESLYKSPFLTNLLRVLRCFCFEAILIIGKTFVSNHLHIQVHQIYFDAKREGNELNTTDNITVCAHMHEDS